MDKATGSNPQKYSRRQFIQRGFGLAFALGAAVTGSSVAQAYGLSIERTTHQLAGLEKPLKIVFLTDLHYGPFIGVGSVHKWVKVAMQERPNLILLGGDFLDTFPGEMPDEFFAELANLKAPLGVFGVWGNHDYGSFGSYRSRHNDHTFFEDWANNRQRLTQAFAEHGISILRNEFTQPREDLHLVGIDDWWRGEPATSEQLMKLLEPAQQRASLLLSHNPDVLPILPQHVGLVLSGHTHGGQVRFPIKGAVVVPSSYGTTYDMGWKEGAYGSPAYVSRGLGLSGLPIRMLCAPEVTVLNLEPAEGDKG